MGNVAAGLARCPSRRVALRGRGLAWVALLVTTGAGRWAFAVQAEPAPPPGADFTAEVRVLSSVAACGRSSSVPAPAPASEKSARVVEEHCAALARDTDSYRHRWLEPALPFLRSVVPPSIPDRVVYPFGGGDLVTALATFPSASEITTISLELAGDVRPIRTLEGRALREALADNRRNLRNLLRVCHSKTTNLRVLMREYLPGELVFALTALAIHDLEPVWLRYFRIEPDGKLTYLTDAEVNQPIEMPAGSRAFRREIERRFGNVEIGIRARSGGPIRIYRHIAANLDDEHLRAQPGLLAHLESKGKVAVMVKAASYLLWFNDFSRIRSYVLTYADWMVSDSTGVPPELAAQAGFRQDTYGKFVRPFLGVNRRYTKQFVRLWRRNPHRALPIRFGYPDGAHHNHMVVMYRGGRSAGPTPVATPVPGAAVPAPEPGAPTR